MDDVEPLLEACGFIDRKVILKEESKNFIKNWLPGSGAEDYVVSANITATKPCLSQSTRNCVFIEPTDAKLETTVAPSSNALKSSEESSSAEGPERTETESPKVVSSSCAPAESNCNSGNQ